MFNSNLRRVLNIAQRNLIIRQNSLVSKLVPSVRTFSSEDNIKQRSVVDTAQKELDELKRSYEPVQKSEKEEFLSKNRWVLFEYEKENLSYLELKKSQDEFDVTVRFTAKAPETPSEERGKQGINSIYNQIKIPREFWIFM
jgi:hypothetical protein